ncbi:MAG: photosystem I assembly protein Ycf3 [Methanoregulaceae archaeon PtaU1.Bin222]|nr:MAG: photosystem I assembly protein Ycf3 [Methanoregulaceae archaeon PtaU1.Bin222]
MIEPCSPGTITFHSDDFIDGKEQIVLDTYSSEGRSAAVLIQRTAYGSYLLFLRSKDTHEEQRITEGSLSYIVAKSNEMCGREDQADEKKPVFRLDDGTLTVDGYPILKIFGSESGKRWFATFIDEVTCVSHPEPGLDTDDPSTFLQYFGVIQDGDTESWEFWMDEELEPLFKSGEVRAYHARDFDDIDESEATIQQQPGPRIAEYEATLKSLVDDGRYKEAIEYSDSHGSVLYDCDADTCTFYSYKIIGVCRSKDIRKSWDERGYRPPHWIEAGNVLFDAGKYQEAVEAYHKRIEENDNDDRAWYLMGCAYRAMGNPYESVEAWDEAFSIVMKDDNVDKLDTDPGSASSWAERGDIEYNQENWKEAIDFYGNSLSIDHNQPEIWFRKGCSHFEREEFDEAMAAFLEVVKLDPRHFYALNDMGIIHCRSGHNATGAMQFKAALSIVPDGSFEATLIGFNLEKAGAQRDGIPFKDLTFLS